MSMGNPVWLAVAVLVVLGGIVALVLHFLSPESKLERRRRRNNYRVVSKVRRPMIRLNTRDKEP